ncbi:MAG: ATP-dependent DNA helicase RecG [Ignavibacteria bacterium]|nr:ATP-dependent DNA helicase RecG [Ignavibacteria bacterium]
MNTTPPPPSELPVTSLPGVGSFRAQALGAAGIRTVEDLLYHFPRRYLDRSTIVPMTELYRFLNQTVTTIGRITGVVTLGAKKKRLVVTIRDLSSSMDLVFFQGISYWQKSFARDETLAVSGVVTMFGRRPNMVHPVIDRLENEETLEFINTGGIVPVYPSSAELEKAGFNRHGGFRKAIHLALQRHLADIVDPFDDPPAAADGETRATAAPASIRDRHALQPLRDALQAIHRPRSMEARDVARKRLVFDEFFLLSLQLALQKRSNATAEPGIAFRIDSPRARALAAALPFTLTKAQKRVLREITADMAKPEPMNRLLQGDVGSGKTVVALLSMLVAVDNGHQCALMVPTEILAEQHYRTIAAMVNDVGLNIRLLVGQQAPAMRADVLAGVAGGTVDIVVGTHALLEGDVAFHSLGLVVIDEQHRFGVMQRAALRRKGAMPDVLVMTATPIPRTLSMTLYGDLDVSVIDELPANRKNIKTAIRFDDDTATVHEFLRGEVAAGNQAYIVFPLVSESEKLDLKAATAEYERLRTEVFPDLRVGLLHGQLPAKEKDAVMMRFKRHELDILVSTTVIEVGVDVPNATVMVIEHAERFGLAQLHQLRGRVGRGSKQAWCILVTSRAAFYSGGSKSADEWKEQSDARKRLETLRDTLDGFRISEVDMEIRGPGDLWGTAQSGFPELRIANLLTDGDVLAEARAEAFRIIETDPQLRLPAHAQIRAALGPKLRARLTTADIA